MILSRACIILITFQITYALISPLRETYEEFCDNMNLDCEHSFRCCKPLTPDIQQVSVMNDSLRMLITRSHNYYRNIIACGEVMNIKGERLPRAAKMHELSWDPELEKLSQISAEQCRSDWKNICKFVKKFENHTVSQSGKFWKGQEDVSIDDQIADVMRFWFHQYHKTSVFSMKEIFDRPIHRRFNSQIIGELIRLGISLDNSKTNSVSEFLNMVFDDVDKIGCALFSCPSADGLMYSFVCSYDEKRSKLRPVSVVEAKKSAGESCKDRSPRYCCLCRNSSDADDLESGPCDKYEQFIKPFFNIRVLYDMFDYQRSGSLGTHEVRFFMALLTFVILK